MAQNTTTGRRRPFPVDVDTLRQNAPFITLVVLVLFVGALTPAFLQPQTLLVLAADTATLFVLAVGATFVIMLGGIDLSLQAIASLTSVIFALTIAEFGYGAYAFGILAGMGTGLLNGVAHVQLRIPSFITTLAASGLWSGVALIISDARAIPIGEAGRTLLRVVTGTTLGLPNEVLIGAVILIAGIVLQRYTLFGRYSTAIGAGEPATRAAGVRVDQQKVIAFTLSGAMAGLAGVVLASRLASGSPTLANEFLLPAIAAVVVGGTAITGGVGSVWRTLVGALIISVVRIGMTFINVDIFAQQIVFGIVLIFAVAITIDRSKIPIVK